MDNHEEAGCKYIELKMCLTFLRIQWKHLLEWEFYVIQRNTEKRFYFSIADYIVC